MQTHTHDIVLGETEVRKRFVTASREAEREWRCLNLIWSHAPGLAPRPLRYERSGDNHTVVMERLPGSPLGTGPLTDTQLESLGRCLSSLFAIPTDAVLEAGISERRLGPSALRLSLPAWLQEPQDLSLCRDAPLVREGLDAATEWLARPAALPSAQLTAMGIADLNPANIIWDGRVCRLLDFEDGGLTDPAYDIADHVEHIANRSRGVLETRSLSDAVGLSDAERDRVRAYRPVWAAFWLVMLLPGNGGFARNPAGTTESQARHLLSLLSG